MTSPPLLGLLVSVLKADLHSGGRRVGCTGLSLWLGVRFSSPLPQFERQERSKQSKLAEYKGMQ